MEKRVRISNSSVNSYGARVVTDGVDISQYMRNPVLLYMHERGNVIGYVDDVKKEGDDITGVLKFDEASELSIRCKNQYEFGSIRMVSAGLEIDIESITENADDSEVVDINTSKLFEVSLVDIGANDDAIVLTRQGNNVNLSKGELLTLAKTNNMAKKKEIVLAEPEKEEVKPEVVEEPTQEQEEPQPQEQKEEEKDEKDVLIEQLQEEIAQLKEECDKLKAEKQEQEDAELEKAVDDAIKCGKITEESREMFLANGREMGLLKMSAMLNSMKSSVRPSDIITLSKDEVKETWDDLDKKGTLLELKKNDFDKFRQLFKEKFGKDY